MGAICSFVQLVKNSDVFKTVFGFSFQKKSFHKKSKSNDTVVTFTLGLIDFVLLAVGPPNENTHDPGTADLDENTDQTGVADTSSANPTLLLLFVAFLTPFL